MLSVANNRQEQEASQDSAIDYAQGVDLLEIEETLLDQISGGLRQGPAGTW